METRFQESADRFLAGSKGLLPFIPFPTACDRTAYDSLPSALRKKLISHGEAVLDKPYPVILATDFMVYYRTGNRTDYEDLYFERRFMLNSFVLAECVEGEGRFLNRIMDGIFLICEESGWQLPAHNSYARSAPSGSLPDSSRPVLDLFACETGAQLACIHYLLKEQLDRVSPLICERIRRELHLRILQPYLEEHFWWMGDGDEPMCNWTPWCTQNVLITAFLFGCNEESQRRILQRAAVSCDCFLKDYGQDGCCDEGPHYFRRAGLCLDGALSLMNQITDGAFAHLYQWDKIKNIASYIAHVHAGGKYYFNFGDSSPMAGRAGVKEYLFGKHTEQHALMQFAARDHQDAGDEIFQDELYQLSLFYRLQNAFHYAELMAEGTSAPAAFKDIFYPSVGLFIAKSSVFSLAVKAGHNNDGHNHNDVGSIILYKNGKPVLVDIGVESYTQKTFSSQRYEIWTMQSAYHNLPSIEGLDQKDGPQYRATEVTASFEYDTSVITMELAGAYPLPEAGHTYLRRVSLDKNSNCVILTDRTDCRNVILHFITYEKPRQMSDNRLQVGDAELAFAGASLLPTETLPITDRRLKAAWDHDLYRIRLSMTAQEFTMKITDFHSVDGHTAASPLGVGV